MQSCGHAAELAEMRNRIRLLQGDTSAAALPAGLPAAAGDTLDEVQAAAEQEEEPQPAPVQDRKPR